MKPGDWIEQKALLALGPESEGRIQIDLRDALRDAGLKLPVSSMSNMFNYGLNPSTKSSPEMLKVWAKVLKCSVADILLAHNYDLSELDYEPSEAGLQILRLVREATIHGETEKLDQLLRIAEAFMIEPK